MAKHMPDIGARAFVIQGTAVERPVLAVSNWPRAGAPVGEIDGTLLTFKIKI